MFRAGTEKAQQATWINFWRKSGIPGEYCNNSTTVAQTGLMTDLYLKTLISKGFRNCDETERRFNKCGNLIIGSNGEGKTNLLESIYYLSVFRSFRGVSGIDMAQWGGHDFSLAASFETGNDVERSLEVTWEKGRKKAVYLDGDRITKIISLFGMFPMVILSPESLGISQGEPRMRRRFLDLCISTVDREYLQNLSSYKKVLKQRNRLLSGISYELSLDSAEFETWNERLVQHGALLVKRRLEVVETLADLGSQMLSKISGGKEDLEIEYRSSIRDLGSLETSFREQLSAQSNEERRKKRTLTGPHRDDLFFRLKGHDARKYGSQGQHKTILLALKAAESQFIAERTKMYPLLLLDDLFALLDRTRIQAFLNIIKGSGQIFITTNSDIHPEALLAEAGYDDSDFSKHTIQGGTIVQN